MAVSIQLNRFNEIKHILGIRFIAILINLINMQILRLLLLLHQKFANDDPQILFIFTYIHGNNLKRIPRLALIRLEHNSGNLLIVVLII